MPAHPTFSDDDLRDALEEFADEPDTITQVAAKFGVSTSAVSQRVKKLERTAAAISKGVIDATTRNVFDIRGGLQRNYERLERLIESVEENGVAKEGKPGEDGEPHIYMADGVDQLTRLLESTRKYSETSLKCLEALYRVEEIEAFQRDVIAILAECDPTLRTRIMDRIKKRRGVRAAFA